LTGVALNPAMVARVMKAAEPGALVNTLHTSVITAGLAFGSWAGGSVIDADYGLRAPLWVGAGMALLGLLSLTRPWPARAVVKPCA
jgi:predicted MFS family arabinose efflux permease